MKTPLDLAKSVANLLIAKGWTLALAESCTGGLVCATLTELPGSSDWFERGYITYSNQAKSECLGVPAEIIDSFGAVSEQVAKAMAEGAQRNAGVNVAISVTGIAGPSGGSIEKPVGAVCFAWAIEKNTIYQTKYFTGSRQEIRDSACIYALSELMKLINP